VTVGSVSSAAHVLHVGSPAAPAAAAPIAQLAWASLPVEHCPDVYRALARLGHTERKTCAVLVAVDDLDPRDLEFFRVALRYHPAIPIYVYAEPRNQSRIDRCVEFGARGRLTPEAIRALAQAAAMPPERPAPAAEDEFQVAIETELSDEPEGDESHDAPPATGMDALVAGVVDSPAAEVEDEYEEAPAKDDGADEDPLDEFDPDEPAPDESAEPSAPAMEAAPPPEAATEPDDQLMDLVEDEVSELLDQEADELTEEDLRRADAEASDRGPARVPWLRYDDRPVRLPPQRTPPPPARVDTAPPPPPEPDSADPAEADDAADEPQPEAAAQLVESAPAAPPQFSFDEAIQQILAEEASRLSAAASTAAEPPPAAEPEAPEAPPAEPAATDRSADDDYEPLLSLEELEALIGDDDNEAPPAPRREERRK
jgi:hypothetical protein